jgi:hypothetical protein
MPPSHITPGSCPPFLLVIFFSLRTLVRIGINTKGRAEASVPVSKAISFTALHALNILIAQLLLTWGKGLLLQYRIDEHGSCP